MKTSVIFEGGVAKVSTLSDGSLSINIHTQELPEETMMRIFQLRKKPGMVLLSTDDKISKEEQDAVEGYTASEFQKGKSPSQLLRSVLYRVWEQRNQPEEFDLWYRNQMEAIINKYKATLDG